MEERSVRLEADVEVLKTDVGVLKTDVGVLKTDVAVLKKSAEHIEKSVSEIPELRKAHDRDFRFTFAALIAVALGLAGLMAKGFGWLH